MKSTRFKKIISLLLTLTMILSGSLTSLAADTYQQTDIIKIYTKEDLNNVRNNLSGNYKLMNDIEFTASDFMEGGAYYNNGYGWIPIGMNQYGYSNFYGTFDGNNHEIKGLSVISIREEGGLFVNVRGEIKNLGLIDIKVLNKNRNNLNQVGGIAGYVSGEGNILNCHISGSIEGYYAGGIVGKIYDNGKVSNCYNTGCVTAFHAAGGIAGYIDNSTSINNCYNMGIITSDEMAGGVVGHILENGSVEKCYNQETITGRTIGGIVGSGYGNGFIRDCFNTAVLKGSDVGGIVGDIHNNMTVSCCHNDGEIVSTYYGGGISGVITNSVRVILSNNTGRIVGDGSHSIGGIVGYMTGNTYVDKCYSKGKIVDNRKSNCSGGIAGTIDGNGNINNCYNVGAVTGNYVGGVVGDIFETGIVSTCYNTGTVTGNKEGAIVGDKSNETNTINCYYLTNTVSNKSHNGIECTENEMVDYSTYKGFDFDNTWIIDCIGAYKYPQFRNMMMDEPISIEFENLSSKAVKTTEGVLPEINATVMYKSSDIYTGLISKEMLLDCDINTPGTYTARLKLGNVISRSSIEINVVPRSLDSIKVTKLPQTKYVSGIDKKISEDGIITLYYNNGTSEEIPLTSEMMTGFNCNKKGKQKITVTYKGKQDQFVVEVITIDQLKIIRKPNKTVYVKDQPLNMDGLICEATYSDGSRSNVSVDMLQFDYDKKNVGEVPVHVILGEQEAVFNITVKEKIIKSFSVDKTNLKTEYIEGEELDKKNTKMKVVYESEDNYTELIPLEKCDVIGYDPLLVGPQAISVKYLGVTTRFAVQVMPKKVISIKLSSAPYKTEYIIGQELDLAGGKICVDYNNGKSETIAMTHEMLNGYDPNVLGEQLITVKYDNFSCEFKIVVCDKTMEPKDYRITVIDENAKTCEINRYTGKDGNIIIPKIIEGYKVIGIGNYAFCDLQYFVNNVIITDGVQYIGTGAFSRCKGLKSVSIPDSVTFIGTDTFSNAHDIKSMRLPKNLSRIPDRAFQFCENLMNIDMPLEVTSIGEDAFAGCEKLDNIEIPTGVTSIGTRAFSDCKSISEITLPLGITQILNDTFSNCVGLKKINIPDSVTDINSCAFMGCEELTTVNIPKNVKMLAIDTFYMCSNLQSLNVADENKNYSSINGVIFDKEKRTLIMFPSGRSDDYTIPEQVTRIQSQAFSGCRPNSVIIPGTVVMETEAFALCDVKNIIMLEGITEIPDYAFMYTSMLQSVKFPSSLRRIGNNAFYGSELESINLPDGLISIGESAFMFGNGMGIINIPSTVESIGAMAFTGCNTIGFNVDSNNKFYAGKNGVLFNKDETRLIYFPGGRSGSYTIPESVMYIEPDAFSYSKLNKIAIGKNTKEISAQIFLDCGDLLEILVDPGNLNYSAIDGVLFNKDRTILISYPHARLGKYNIPRGVKQLEQKAFCDSAIDEIGIPLSINKIGAQVFETFSPGGSAINIWYEGSEEQWKQIDIDPDNYNLNNAVIHYNSYNASEEPLIDILGTSMTMGNDLSMNFYVEKAKLNGRKDVYAEVTRKYSDYTPQQIVKMDFSEWIEKPEHYVIPFNGIAAKEMNDMVTVRIMDNSGQILSTFYSDCIHDYALRMIQNSRTNELLKTCFVDMLNYGSEAQKQFNYDVGGPVNRDIDTYQNLATKNVALKDIRVKGTNYYGTSLSLKTNIRLGMYFTNIDQAKYAKITYTNHHKDVVEYKIDAGQFVQKNSSTGKYTAINIDKLLVSDVSQPVTCEVYDASDNLIGSATDSVESYCARMKDKGSLYIPIMKFGVSARTYFGNRK